MTLTLSSFLAQSEAWHCTHLGRVSHLSEWTQPVPTDSASASPTVTLEHVSLTLTLNTSPETISCLLLSLGRILLPLSVGH